MGSLAISGVVFGCVFGGTVLGMVLRAVLPKGHLSEESKDVVKLGMGLVGTMTALVLGLMIASAKSSFDTQRVGLAQLCGNVILLDRVLAHFGPETKDARDMLRVAVIDTFQRAWPKKNPESGQAAAKAGTEGRYSGLYDKIHGLEPKNDTQRSLQAQALKTAMDTAQMRWALIEERGSSIPVPFLVVMVVWLALLFASFSLFAPPNPTVVATLTICALSISSALFLILEMDQPFGGFMRLSDAPVRIALEKLGR